MAPGPILQLFLSSQDPERLTESLWPAVSAIAMAGGRAALGIRLADPAAPMFAEYGYPSESHTNCYVEVRDAVSERIVWDPLRSALAELTVHSGCRVAAGRYRVILPGWGAYALLHPLRRAKGTSPDQFDDYWGGGHTSKRQPIPELLGYVQHRVDRELSAELAARIDLPPADFDGVSSIYTGSAESYERVMASRGAAGGLRDNAHFVDVGASPYIGLWHLRETTADNGIQDASL